jgi:putative spermidine/putrescine transport system permease protein
VLLIQLWKNGPFQLVIMTSALESVRTDVKEAARNLGAGPLALFRHIILPLTVPSALVAVILVFIGTFGDFAISSTAGPLYPMSLSVLMHTRAYRFQEWNLSACVGVMMIITTVVFVLLYTRLGASLRETEGGAPRRRGR